MNEFTIIALIWAASAAAPGPEFAVLPPRVLADPASEAEGLPAALRRHFVEAIGATGRPAHAPQLPAWFEVGYVAGRFAAADLEALRGRTSAPRFLVGALDIVDGQAVLTVRVHVTATGRIERQVRLRGPLGDAESLARRVVRRLFTGGARVDEAEAPASGAPEAAPQDTAVAPAQPSVAPEITAPAVVEPAPPPSTVAAPVAEVTGAQYVSEPANVPARALFWGGLSLTVAGAASAAVSLLHYERRLEDGQLRSGVDNQRLYTRGRGLLLAGEISAGVGLGAMALGTVLWLTGVGEDEAGARVAFAPTRGGAQAELQLRF